MTARPPLAELLRPHSMGEFLGQDATTGPRGLVRLLLDKSRESHFFPSLIFWGPPGCGKTTLARIIARELGREWHEFSAVNASVKEIERVLPARGGQSLFLSPVVFIDEIHRFNKTQQDALLPHVERGDMIFLGATTENPSFTVIRPLISRCRVIVLQSLDEEAVGRILDRALPQLAQPSPTLEPAARDFLIQVAQGDARVALSTLEVAFHLLPAPDQPMDTALIEQALQNRQVAFDRHGEEYYNTISALHKCVRGSDPDAALYWLARMLEAGQDPRYIARRLIRAASEDIGLADPQALVIATAAFHACANLGPPECNLALAECAVYLAQAPKSNTLYTAYGKAAEDVRTHGHLPVPLHIRNAPTTLMKNLGYGQDYQYEHSPQGIKNPDIEYFPDKLRGRRYLNRENPP
jgi:putative ATPase